MLLRHEINYNELNDEELELDLFSVSCSDYYGDEDKTVVNVEYENNLEFFVGESISVTNTIDREDGFGETYTVNVSETQTIAECNNTTKTFSFITDKYQKLTLESVWVEVEENVPYLHFKFSEWHFFRSWESYGISFTISYPKTATENGVITFDGCQYVSDVELKLRYDNGFDELNDFMCSVFGFDKYVFVGYAEDGDSVLDEYSVVDEIPDTACFTDEMYVRVQVVLQEKPFCGKWALYEKECNDGSVSGLDAKRVNYKYKDVNNVYFYVTLPVASINVPISAKTASNTYQEQNINSKFISVEVQNHKNGFVEMEKLVYHPVFKVTNPDGTNSYVPIKRIKFNLHFRERKNNRGWIVKNDGLWNGMSSEEPPCMYGDVTQQNVVKYFSYVPNDFEHTIDRGRQSDLLCYLGFTDNDVKYQKSKLKKSFLRLSFYDSMNRANQNLLAYSTVFVDCGNLFSKMMRGADKKYEDGGQYKGEYVKTRQESNTVRYDNARVDTEPYLQNHTSYSVEEIEERRLSSQFVVSDRFSEASSEGFYLYLWADNDNGGIPYDVYMRVDFNHAGYGRVVPMTMPYKAGTSNPSIYTMDEIFAKWTDSDITKRGWGVRMNEKYSYIHFKCVYDSNAKRHVYYLDTDTYGTLVSYDDSTPDELEINLYEPKINFQ